MSRCKHPLKLAALTILLTVSCIDNDIPYPLVYGNITEFEVEGQVGEAKIDNETRTVTIEVADSIDLANLQIVKFATNPEANSAYTAGSVINCVNDADVLVETYQQWHWTIRATQKFAPRIRMHGQLGEMRIIDNTISIYVSSLSDAYATDLRLAAGPVTYEPDITKPSNLGAITTITATSYGVSTQYVLILNEVKVPYVTIKKTEPWAKFCHVSVEALCIEPTKSMVEYRVQGEEQWQKSGLVPVDAGLNDVYTVTLKKLQPSTTYEYRGVADTILSPITTFTTDAAEQLPNTGFNEWHSEDRPGNYLWSDNYKHWFPWSESDTEFWQTKNRWLHEDRLAIQRRPSNVSPDADAKRGANAVKMETAPYKGEGLAATDWGGVFPGCIFTGTVEKLGSVGEEWKSVKLGRPYTYRPTFLTGWYRYAPKIIDKHQKKHPSGAQHVGNLDQALIYIYLLDWSDKTNPYLNDGQTPSASEIIAYGEQIISGEQQNYTKFRINLNYRNLTKRPTHIIVYATSSRYGHWLCGGEGTTLWVDEFELGFDYIEQ